MKILITGGAGFIGSHLCERFVGLKEDVVCIDNFLSGDLRNIRGLLDCRNFKFVKGDVRDKGILHRVIPGVDMILHLAAQVHVDRSYIEPELTWDINVRGTQCVLEAAKEYGIERIIFASSSEVYGSAIDGPIKEEHPLAAPHPYGASKIAADRMCYAYKQTYGMDITIARFFNIFGPRQRDAGYGGVISIFTRRALMGQPLIVYGDGEQTRDYLYIDDAIAAYEEISKRPCPSAPVNFGSAKEISIRRLAEKVCTVVGVRNLETGIKHVERRIGEVQRLVADIGKAKFIYGWEPTIDFDDDLAQLVEWYRKWGFEERLVC